MFDVVIVGAGVTGSAIAREISRYKLKACVIEKEEDVCNGTSKANSAIIHAGFDAEPGTVKAKMNVQGNAMMDQIAKELDIPFKREGSIVVCTKEQDPAQLQVLLERGKANGVPGLQILNREELLAKEPNLADEVTCGLWAPTCGIVCPFHMTMGYAENACSNGVEFFLNTKVEELAKTVDGFKLRVHHTDTDSDEVMETKILINAAGVYADRINNQLSEKKLHITARKGEYMLLDKTVGNHVKSTIFQLPSRMGKGVLVTPTVHGNLLVGPTSVNVDDKEAVNTTADGLNFVGKVSALSVKNVPLRQVITSFAGLRAHEEGDDFVIGEAPDVKGLINAAGMESPGLSSAPAVGAAVAEMVKAMLDPEDNPDFDPIRHGILDPDTLSLEERNQLIKEKPAYGNIICRCEMVTEGEILDAIHRPLGARSLDAVKRRTRAGMGRCQAGFCSPRVMEILARELPMPIERIGKNGAGSGFIVGVNKELEV
jgi:glycerol-3-phosphate dehydrogenase